MSETLCCYCNIYLFNYSRGIYRALLGIGSCEHGSDQDRQKSLPTRVTEKPELVWEALNCKESQDGVAWMELGQLRLGLCLQP